MSEPGRADLESPGSEEGVEWPEELVLQREALRAIHPPVSPVLDALRAWRDSAARAARIQPEAVLADHVLARIATQRPPDVDALGAINGVGPILARRFGEDILAALDVGEVA